MTTTTQHTPGPWHNVLAPNQVVAGPRIIAGILSSDVKHGEIHPDEARANARLIASAPDLLEALQILLVQCGDPEKAHTAMLHAINIANRAVQKATSHE